jgi:hypothetical protein
LREKAEKADQLQAQLDKLTAAKQWEQTMSKVSKDTGIPVSELNLVDADRSLPVWERELQWSSCS